jgi:hypothetical protein
MATSRNRRRAEPKLDDQGRTVFRYDKRQDGSEPRFATAREGSTKFDLLNNTDGWEPVDADERAAYDKEAAATRFQAAQDARAAEDALLNLRHGQLSTLDGPTGARGRGRPSNSEKAAINRAEAAESQLADKDAAIAELQAKLAELDKTGDGS